MKPASLVSTMALLCALSVVGAQVASRKTISMAASFQTHAGVVTDFNVEHFNMTTLVLCRDKDSFGTSLNSIAYAAIAPDEKGMIGIVDGTKTCYIAELKDKRDCFSELTVYHSTAQGILRVDYRTKSGNFAMLGESSLDLSGLIDTKLDFSGGCLCGFYGKQAESRIIRLGFLYSSNQANNAEAAQQQTTVTTSIPSNSQDGDKQ